MQHLKLAKSLVWVCQNGLFWTLNKIWPLPVPINSNFPPESLNIHPKVRLENPPVNCSVSKSQKWHFLGSLSILPKHINAELQNPSSSHSDKKKSSFSGLSNISAFHCSKVTKFQIWPFLPRFDQKNLVQCTIH